ncbi:protein of unknown function [Chryseobacterium sp. JV274]|nr:protein of unknown function [Chryseobacterium sp. JV274]
MKLLYFFFIVMVSVFLKAQSSSFMYQLNYRADSDILKVKKIFFT